MINSLEACARRRRQIRETTEFHDASITDEMVMADLEASLK